MLLTAIPKNIRLESDVGHLIAVILFIVLKSSESSLFVMC